MRLHPNAKTTPSEQIIRAAPGEGSVGPGRQDSVLRKPVTPYCRLRQKTAAIVIG